MGGRRSRIRETMGEAPFSTNPERDFGTLSVGIGHPESPANDVPVHFWVDSTWDYAVLSQLP